MDTVCIYEVHSSTGLWLLKLSRCYNNAPKTILNSLILNKKLEKNVLGTVYKQYNNYSILYQSLHCYYN